MDAAATSARQHAPQSAHELRMRGNALFKNNEFEAAALMYTRALETHPDDHAALSNRARAHQLLGRPLDSAQDALHCIKVAPGWHKGYMRLAAALVDLAAWQEAAAVAAAGLQQVPDDKELSHLLSVATQQQTQSQLSERCQRQLLASNIANCLLQAQQASLHADLEEQLANSMAAPGEWTPHDWDWRPLWTQEMRWPPLSPTTNSPDSTTHQSPNPPPVVPHSTATTPLDHPPAPADPTAPPAPATAPGPAATAPPADSQATQGPSQGPGAQTTPGNNTAEAGASTASMPVGGASSGSCAHEDVVDGGGDSDGDEWLSSCMMLAQYCHVCEELAAPHELLAVLRDEARLRAYACAIKRALEDNPELGVHVLCLGPGAPLWALMAAAAGAACATAVCCTNVGYQAALACINANQHVHNWGAVRLAEAPLHACRVAGPTQAGDRDCCSTDDTTGGGGSMCVLSGPATLVVTDNLDHSILGKGLVTDLEVCVSRGLLAPRAVVLPDRLQLVVQLSQEARVGVVRGLDLSLVNNNTAWYPGPRPTHLNSKPHELLTPATVLATVHLTSAVEVLMTAALQPAGQGQHHKQAAGARVQGTTSSSSLLLLPHQAQRVAVTACADGVCNAVHVWPLLCFGPHGGDVTWDTCQGTVTMPCAPHADGQAPAAGLQGTPSGSNKGGSITAARQGDVCSVPPSPLWQPSLPQAALYVDPFRVQPGQQVELAVLVESSAVHVTRWPPAPSSPRSLLLPAWHVDLILDDARTDAYHQAIGLAVSQQTVARGGDVVVVDLGAGTGLLSMMTAMRCGSNIERVYALEPRRGTASLLQEVLACNPSLAPHVCVLPHSLASLATRLLSGGRVVNADVEALKKRPADVVVLQNLDAGLLGEGVLPCLALGRASGLIAHTTTVIPSAAKVMFQLISLAPTVADLKANALSSNPLAPSLDPDYDPDLHLDLHLDLHTPVLDTLMPTTDGDYAALDLRPLGVGVSNSSDSSSSNNSSSSSSATGPPSVQGWVNSPAGVWRPMSQELLGMPFDFSRAHELHSMPEAQEVQATAITDGLVNAVAFWYQLDMLGADTFGGGPLSGQQTRSQQVAVQQFGPAALRVKAGDQLRVHLAHDTYTLKFQVLGQGATGATTGPAEQHTDTAPPDMPGQTATPSGGPRPPEVHPVVQRYTAVSQALGAELSKACAQDPLAFRRLASAAVGLAARPHDYQGPGLGPGGRLPAAQAAQLAAQMCG